MGPHRDRSQSHTPDLGFHRPASSATSTVGPKAQAAPICLALSLEALVATIRRRVVDIREAEAAREAAAQERAERRAAMPKSKRKKITRGADPALTDRVVGLRKDGLSYREIAAEVDVSHTKVGRILGAAA